MSVGIEVRAIEDRDRGSVNALFHANIHDVGKLAVGPMSLYEENRWPLHTYVAVDERGRVVGALHGQVLPSYFQMMSGLHGAPAENYLRRRVRHITHLAVDLPARGQGIGSQLMAAALGRMCVDGVRQVGGFLQDSDAKARGFYRRHGFDVIPDVPPFAPQYPAAFHVERDGEWFYQRLTPPATAAR